MPYTHCTACGAKALVGATRCPRCQVPFVSYDIAGERVPTVNCPTCGVQRPVAIGVCPNCAMSTAPAGARLTRGLLIVGLAIAGMMAVGYVISRRVDGTKTVARPAVDSLAATESAPSADTTRTDTASVPSETAPRNAMPIPAVPAPAAATPKSTPPASAAIGMRNPAVSGAPVPVDPAMVRPKPAPPPTVAVTDAGEWESAVATTWVRVRSAPTRESDVLRMVDSAQHVRLGPPQNGWRPVRVGVDRGWVDPRLFTLVPAPRP